MISGVHDRGSAIVYYLVSFRSLNSRLCEVNMDSADRKWSLIIAASSPLEQANRSSRCRLVGTLQTETMAAINFKVKGRDFSPPWMDVEERTCSAAACRTIFDI